MTTDQLKTGEEPTPETSYTLCKKYIRQLKISNIPADITKEQSSNQLIMINDRTVYLMKTYYSLLTDTVYRNYQVLFFWNITNAQNVACHKIHTSYNCKLWNVMCEEVTSLRHRGCPADSLVSCLLLTEYNSAVLL